MSSKLCKLALFFIFILLVSCKSSIDESVININLNTGWEFRSSNSTNWKPAIVPGDILVNLNASNVLSDTQIFYQPESFKWIENVGWEYRNTFNVSDKFLASENISLLFKGLDTYADVYLNDSLILKANNVFRSWEVPCKTLLKLKNNRLYIYFYPLSERKNRACGIYKPVILKGWSNAKIEGVYFYLLSLTEKEAQYNAEVTILSSKEQALDLEILVDQKYVIKLSDLDVKQGLNKQIVSFTIRNPKLWWLNGLGRQYLYNVAVRLNVSNNVMDETITKLGVRKLELGGIRYLNDDSIFVKLNGMPVFLKGVVLMPPHNLLSGNDSVIIDQLLENVRKANINFIRILGQGYYPDDIFYDLCDAKGILLWQDIILSNILKHDSTQFKYLGEDFVWQVKQLRNHPSLAFWYGNTSILGNQKIVSDTLDTSLKSRLLSSLVSDGDLKNQYFLFSEISNSINDFIFTPYRRIKYVTAQKSTSEKGSVGNKIGRNAEIALALKKFRFADTSFTTRNYILQILQAEELRKSIEAERINRPVSMGTVVWQYNDYLPSVSGSLIDYFGRSKPAWFTLKNSYAGVSIVPVRKNGYIEIIGINDELKDVDAILLCKVLDFNGNDFFVKQIPVQINANSAKILLTLKESMVLANQSKTKICFLVQLNQPGQTIAQNVLYFADLSNIQFPKTSILKTITQSGKGYNIILRSDILVSNVVMQTLKKDAIFVDNNFLMLPGKRYKIQVHYAGTKEELEKDLVINSLNNSSFNQ
jgi:beta-mannosidase